MVLDVVIDTEGSDGMFVVRGCDGGWCRGRGGNVGRELEVKRGGGGLVVRGDEFGSWRKGYSNAVWGVWGCGV